MPLTKGCQTTKEVVDMRKYLPWMRKVCPFLLAFHQLDGLSKKKGISKEIQEIKSTLALIAERKY